MTGRRVLGALAVALVAAALTANVLGRYATAAALTGTTVAVIGDYGVDSTAEANVATMVAGWSPSAVVTVGDNYYSGVGGSSTGRYDLAVGKYYCGFLKGAATGTNCPSGGTADVNRFFPATGNHDYSDGGPSGSLGNYTTYFALPSNERYYSQVVGDVEFFFVDSQACLASSTEMATEKSWLQSALAGSATAWQVVVFHHPPYSSSSIHGSELAMRWDFATWGADLVLTGHDHTYERLSAGGLTYVVDGLGGASRYSFGTPLAESQARYNEGWGALKLVSSPTALTGAFISLDGVTQDTFSITTGFGPRPGAFGKSSPARNAKQVSRTPTLTWGTSSGARTIDGYEYCIDATVNSACDGSWVATSSTSATPTLLAKKTYEWQVRAVNSVGTTYANGGTWWKFTTVR